MANLLYDLTHVIETNLFAAPHKILLDFRKPLHIMKLMMHCNMDLVYCIGNVSACLPHGHKPSTH
jgi:hypothetical protein